MRRGAELDPMKAAIERPPLVLTRREMVLACAALLQAGLLQRTECIVTS